MTAHIKKFKLSGSKATYFIWKSGNYKSMYFVVLSDMAELLTFRSCNQGDLCTAIKEILRNFTIKAAIICILRSGKFLLIATFLSNFCGSEVRVFFAHVFFSLSNQSKYTINQSAINRKNRQAPRRSQY